MGNDEFVGRVDQKINDIEYRSTYRAFNYPLFTGDTHVTSSYAESRIYTSNIFDGASQYVTKYDGSYRISMGDGHSGMGDLNVYCAGSNGTSNGSSSVSVFAGFYTGGKTYNRSYWLVPNDIDGKDVGFYPTQHWAGPNIGGVLADA